MPEELLPFDAEQYTKGRLSQTDPDVVRALNAAKRRCRNYCGWHVSPVQTDTVVLNGAGDFYLFLPTLKLVSVTSVTENGVALDPADWEVAANVGAIVKTSRMAWKCGFSNIEVEFEHGFTAAEAEDFREAVLSVVDQASMTAGEGRAGALISKRVDDIHLSWSGLPAEVENAPMDKRLLAPYKLLAI